MSATDKNHINISVIALDPRIETANRILLGEGGQAANPGAAASLYRAALDQGVAAAGERLAVLAAAGAGRKADWVEAITWLVRSADMGHTPAQGQLAVLAGQPGAQIEGSWGGIAQQIDLKGLLRAPVLVKQRDAPSIAFITGLATPAMCEWLIHRGKSGLAPAMVGDYATGQWIRDPIRTGLAAGFGLVTTDMVMVLTQKRLELASGLLVQQQEAPFVLSYEVGQEYKAHYDFLKPNEPAFAHLLEALGQRVATCLTWLNDDYDGGETAFLKIDWRHKGRIGDAMLFLNVRPSDRRPDPMTLHAGTPVTRGRKWLLSQWVRDRAQPIV